MSISVDNGSSKHTTNLWKEAYNTLKDEEKGNARLEELEDIHKKELNNPSLKLRSEDSYTPLQVLVTSQSQKLANSV
jgi:hypothetical protein